MSCQVDIQNIIDEVLIGNLTPVMGLTPDQVAGILAGVKAYVDQPYNVLTDAGLGSYGLDIYDLQLICIMKKGFAYPEISVALSDPSVFTGSHNISNVDDLLTDEGIQQEIANSVMLASMEDLQAQGIITGDESDEELAAFAALAMKYSADDIKGLLAAKGGDILGAATGFLDGAMDALAGLAVVGMLVASVKNADILGKLKGLGADIASVVDNITDSIDQSDTNDGANSIIGSNRVDPIT